MLKGRKVKAKAKPRAPVKCKGCRRKVAVATSPDVGATGAFWTICPRSRCARGPKPKSSSSPRPDKPRPDRTTRSATRGCGITSATARTLGGHNLWTQMWLPEPCQVHGNCDSFQWALEYYSLSLKLVGTTYKAVGKVKP